MALYVVLSFFFVFGAGMFAGIAYQQQKVKPLTKWMHDTPNKSEVRIRREAALLAKNLHTKL
jgi:hypothetical protein